MRQSQGCTKNEDNSWKDQYGRSMGAMPPIMVQQENERQLDTIRARAIERNIWRQGRKDSARMRSEGSGNVGITGMAWNA